MDRGGSSAKIACLLAANGCAQICYKNPAVLRKFCVKFLDPIPSPSLTTATANQEML